MVSNFEEEIMDALESCVDNDGVILRREQKHDSGNESLQVDQYVDIVVDSPHRDYYIGIEATSCEGSGSKFYWSTSYDTNRLEKQITYQQTSGRDVFVCVNIDGESYDSNRLLFPIEYFQAYYEAGESGIEWSQLIEDGVSWTTTITLDDLDDARLMPIPQVV